jgi:gamma-glutamyltranspeptidase / glutathione hydrolase
MISFDRIACILLLAVTTSSHAYAGGWIRPERAQHAMVVSAHDHASRAGLSALEEGGNFIDAAVATGFALAVVYPKAGNLGGGGFMLTRMASGQTTFLDFRERAPENAARDMYLGSDGEVVENLSTLGYQAIAVPGSVKGLVHAHRRWGRLPLRRVMVPAIRLAQSGFALTSEEARSLSSNAGLAQFAESRRIFQNNGRGWQQGDVFRQPELARTLKRIAESPDDFYIGRLARQIADDIQAGGGLITLEDLKTYQIVEREPLRGTYRGVEILTAPPPSSGGVALLESLNILEAFDLSIAGLGSAASMHLMAEAFKRAFYDRAQFLGDPDFGQIPVRSLIDKAYAVDWQEGIQSDSASASISLARPDRFIDLVSHAERHPVQTPNESSTQTTHYSIVDEEGNAVAVTTTLNGSYGSKVTIGRLGFLMNNEMDDFSARAGTPNMFGLIQGKANEIAPKKRPLSAMTPTIAAKDGKLWLVLGSPGGPAIITSVASFIVGVVDYRLDIQQAVNSPRVHHQWLPDRIVLEPHVNSPDTITLLKALGHEVAFSPSNTDGACIQIDLQTGERLGASDVRNASGKAIGY